MAIYRGTGGANEATDLATNQAVIAKEFAEQAANSATQANLTLDTFQDIYLGAFASNPALDNDGNALQVGALYFNTSDQLLRVWNGMNWLVSAVSEPSSFTRNTFSGTGSQTVFTLSTTPVNNDSVFVFISGVLTSAYNVSGTTLTFTSAPASGTNNVLAIVASTVSTLAPADNSVSTAKLQDGAVTTSKLGDLQVTTPKLGNSQVTTAKIADANITLAKMASNSVDSSKIVDGSVGSSELASNSVVTSKIADANVTTAKLANNSVTTGKLAREGTSGQVLVSGGAGADPSYVTLVQNSISQSDSSDTITDTGSNGQRTLTIDGVVREVQTATSRQSTIDSGTVLYPEFKCRAWANFNGTLTGTNAPRAGGNVASVTRNGTGDYTITFSTPMPDANYSISVAYGNGTLSGAYSVNAPFGTPTTSGVRIAVATVATTPVLIDAPYINIQIFR